VFKPGTKVPHVEALRSHMQVTKADGGLNKQSGEIEVGGRNL
jgi:hypothetical protein